MRRWLEALVSCSLCLGCDPAPQDRTPTGVVPAEIDGLVERYEALGRFSGAVAVAVDGERIFAKGYGLADREGGRPNTVNTRFALASLTKQFTAAAVLKLEAEGRLRVEDPVSAYLPDYPRPQGDRVTIHHLLSHTSGIPSLWRLGDGLESVEPTREAISLDELRSLFDSRDLLFEPGERFRYSNSGYVVLAAIIESVTGSSYADYLRDALFRPLGMKDTGCGPARGDAIPYRGYPPAIKAAPVEHASWSVGDGCAYSTVLDLVKWNAALRDDRLLPEGQRDKLFASHASIGPGRSYAYGWFLSEAHGRTVAHHGGAAEGIVAEMHRYRDEGLTIVALANYAPRIGINPPAAIADAAAAVFFDLPFTPPPAVYEVAPEELSALAGLYSMDGGGSLLFELDGKRLGVEDPAGERSIFDYGVLPDPAVFEDAVEVAGEAVDAAVSGRFQQIPICAPLDGELAPNELHDEWSQALAGRGALHETTLSRTDRYAGEDTLIVILRLGFETGELYAAFDLTPGLEICGWYFMEPAEYAVRSSSRRAHRVPLFPVGPDELLADGFNHGEQGVRMVFDQADGESDLRLRLTGAVSRTGRR
jgi:CubicO group peptidase (beta-lactamase class C family)